MSADKQMQSLEDGWYFADESFAKSGVYFWNGKENVHAQTELSSLRSDNNRLRAELASLKEERDALRRKIFTNTNGEFTLENRTFSIEGFDFILDNNFDFDAGLNVSGDFGGDEKRHDYMQMICNALNSHYALTQQLAAANGRVERMREALIWARDRGENWGDGVRAALSDLPEADKEKSE